MSSRAHARLRGRIPSNGSLLRVPARYGNGGVLSSQCTVIFGSEATL